MPKTGNGSNAKTTQLHRRQLFNDKPKLFLQKKKNQRKAIDVKEMHIHKETKMMRNERESKTHVLFVAMLFLLLLLLVLQSIACD